MARRALHAEGTRRGAGVCGVRAGRDGPCAHAHVVRPPGHRLDRCAEQDPRPQLGRHALRQLLGAAGEAPLLRAAGRAGEVGEAAAGVEVEQREEE